MPIRFPGYRAAAPMLALLLIGCAAPGTYISGPLSPVSIDGNYLLGPGDKIRLSLYGDENFSGDYGISPDGNISIPLIGNQKVAGSTISDLRNSLSEQLADGYYRDPRLTAEIIAFRPFYIIGEVKNPGAYPYTAGLTLTKAVALAGGYTYRANTRKIAIQRENGDHPVRMEPRSGVKIGPGDTIEILERFF